MKNQITKQPEAELKVLYPKKGKTPGWYFRIREVSNGVYRVEGSDGLGRKVVHSGTEPESLLAECEADAEKINRETGST